ncbi:hypothetical protein N7508_003072 [Penicillium antarcticum]|uniref:uncharacterized protein n=1 Tax=Penicillium antarcticum TaxID=416450 RepID=UPI0023A20938|nr:uncharacterized protein N7508_003072 [Penicillium antarcticum]KAJ5312242.1 hypothetical protein N7508_003072 [Penicillium antarcticum]
MSQPATIQILPTEILHLIAKNLDVFSLINLQHSCQRFCESIPSPTHKQLIEAEKSGLGFQKEFYACRDCLRLRPRAKFADTMIKRKKAKWGPGATDRWCVDCGLHPQPGTNRYTVGNLIPIMGGVYIICLRCGDFGVAAVEDGKPVETPLCEICWRPIRARLRAEQVRQEKARLRAEQAERSARRRGMGYSASYSDDVVPPSPTWSEEFMDLVQAEADSYMNSPGPGSD